MFFYLNKCVYKPRTRIGYRRYTPAHWPFRKLRVLISCQSKKHTKLCEWPERGGRTTTFYTFTRPIVGNSHRKINGGNISDLSYNNIYINIYILMY